MTRKERKIIIKVIENNRINNNRLIEFFAKKYNERYIENRKKKDIS